MVVSVLLLEVVEVAAAAAVIVVVVVGRALTWTVTRCIDITYD